jgi:hypothetical protein
MSTGGIPADHPVLVTVIWVAIIVAIFTPLGVRKYQSISR